MNTDVQEKQVEKTESIKRGIYILPNLVTTGRLFAGFYSLVSPLNGNYSAAAIWIFISAFILAISSSTLLLALAWSISRPSSSPPV